MTLTPAEQAAPSPATTAPPEDLGSAPPVERVTPLDEALKRIATDVHLVLNDHYSGRREEHEAAVIAYARLTVIFEMDDDGETLRDTDGIIEAALDPVRFGLHTGAEGPLAPERTE